MNDTLDTLKAAYQAWHDTKGGSIDTWKALMAENVVFGSIDPLPAIPGAGDRKTRDEVAEYLQGVLADWDMVHFTPQKFVVDGGSIAMFGKCAYRNKATGKEAEIRIAHLWEADGSGITRLVEIFDTAAASRAATPD